MSDGLPRSSADIAAARAELDRQLAPLQRKAELLEQMAEIAEEWERLGGDAQAAATETPHADTKNDAPPSMSQKAKAVLQEKPGQYIIFRDIWQTAVDRGWIKPTRETRSAMRVGLRRLADRDESVDRVDRPPTFAYRWMPPGSPEPSHNGTSHGLWKAAMPVR